MYSTLSTQVDTRHHYSTRVSKDSFVQRQRLQTRLRDSKSAMSSAEAMWRGITWPDSVRARTRQNEEREIWNKHVWTYNEHDIQRHWHTARCRHTSIHITYTRNTSQWWFTTTKVYKHTGAVPKSAMLSAEAIWREITWPDSIRALTKQNEEQDIWNKHVNACVEM